MYKLCFVGTLFILHLLAPANSFRMDPVFNVTGDDASNASDAATSGGRVVTSGGRVVQFSSTPPEVVGMELAREAYLFTQPPIVVQKRTCDDATWLGQC